MTNFEWVCGYGRYEAADASSILEKFRRNSEETDFSWTIEADPHGSEPDTLHSALHLQEDKVKSLIEQLQSGHPAIVGNVPASVISLFGKDDKKGQERGSSLDSWPGHLWVNSLSYHLHPVKWLSHFWSSELKSFGMVPCDLFLSALQ